MHYHYNLRNDFNNSYTYEKMENLVFTKNALEKFTQKRNITWKVYDRSSDNRKVFVFESAYNSNPSQKRDVIRAMITPEQYGIFLNKECGRPIDRCIFRINKEDSKNAYNDFFDNLFRCILKKGKDGEDSIRFNRITAGVCSGIITAYNSEYPLADFINEIHFNRIKPEHDNIIIDSGAITGLDDDNRFYICKVNRDGYIDKNTIKQLIPSSSIIQTANQLIADYNK